VNYKEEQERARQVAKIKIPVRCGRIGCLVASLRKKQPLIRVTEKGVKPAEYRHEVCK